MLAKFCRRLARITKLLRQITSDHIRKRLVADGIDVSGLIIDAIAVPVGIKFPQDTHQLNQSRLNLEALIGDKRFVQKEWTNYCAISSSTRLSATST